MRKIVYALVVTVMFLAAQKLVFALLYRYEGITGILRGAYLGFWMIKGYTAVLLLFCVWQLVRFRTEQSVLNAWIPVTFFSLCLFLVAWLCLW